MNTSGGLELLCDSVKIHDVTVEPQDEEKKVNLLFSMAVRYSVYLTHVGLILLVLTVNHEILALVGPHEFDQGKT